MTKYFITSILVLSVTVPSQLTVHAAKKTRPFPDGFILKGTDGKLTPADSNDSTYKWSFELDSDLITDKDRILAGNRIELLPSAALEKIITDAKEHPNAGYRLWARVTKYKDKNFIFPIYFLPLTEKTKPAQQQTSQQQTQLNINDPTDQLDMPDEILKKLQTRKTIRPQQPLQKGLELKQDFILADRTGFIVEQSKVENRKSQIVFVLDSLGRNPPQVSFKLLPCYALQRAQRKQSTELDPPRFKVSGIVTKYKDQYYLLLQRAIRIYSHENFPK